MFFKQIKIIFILIQFLIKINTLFDFDKIIIIKLKIKNLNTKNYEFYFIKVIVKKIIFYNI